MSRCRLIHKLWIGQIIFPNAKLTTTFPVHSGVYTNTCFHTLSRKAAICHNVEQKCAQSAGKVQLVWTRDRFSFSFKEEEEDAFGKMYNDCIDKEFQLIYAFGNSDMFYKFTLGFCITAPMLFALMMIHYYYKTYKELEYTAQSLSETLENIKEIYMHLPPSFQWVVSLVFVFGFAGSGHHFINKNNFCRLYYSSRKDQYIGIVYQYGQKTKMKFSQKDVVRKPVFLEKFFQKKGFTVGTEKTFFIYENNFCNTSSRNQFFSEVASSGYLDKLQAEKGYRSKPQK